MGCIIDRILSYAILSNAVRDTQLDTTLLSVLLVALVIRDVQRSSDNNNQHDATSLFSGTHFNPYHFTHHVKQAARCSRKSEMCGKSGTDKSILTNRCLVSIIQFINKSVSVKNNFMTSCWL